MFGINLLCCAVVGGLITSDPTGYGFGFGALIGAVSWICIGIVGLWNGWYD